MDIRTGQKSAGEAMPSGQIQPDTALAAALRAQFGDDDDGVDIEGLVEDRARLDRLMWASFAGPEWKAFSNTLARYGYQVIRAWVRSAEIFKHCARKGMGGLPLVPRDGDDATELANETVAMGIDGFRTKVLIPGKWDVMRGATLKSYFIGQCLFQFPNVYRRWLAERTPLTLVDTIDEQVADLNPWSTEVATADVIVELSRQMSIVPANDVRTFKALSAAGYTSADIGRLLKLSKRAVDSRLFRLKAKAA